MTGGAPQYNGDPLLHGFHPPNLPEPKSSQAAIAKPAAFYEAKDQNTVQMNLRAQPNF